MSLGVSPGSARGGDHEAAEGDCVSGPARARKHRRGCRRLPGRRTRRGRAGGSSRRRRRTEPDGAGPTALLSRLHHAAEREIQLGELAEVGGAHRDTRSYGAELTADFRAFDQRVIAFAAQSGDRRDPARSDVPRARTWWPCAGRWTTSDVSPTSGASGSTATSGSRSPRSSPRPRTCFPRRWPTSRCCRRWSPISVGSSIARARGRSRPRRRRRRRRASTTTLPPHGARDVALTAAAQRPGAESVRARASTSASTSASGLGDRAVAATGKPGLAGGRGGRRSDDGHRPPLERRRAPQRARNARSAEGLAKVAASNAGSGGRSASASVCETGTTSTESPRATRLVAQAARVRRAPGDRGPAVPGGSVASAATSPSWRCSSSGGSSAGRQALGRERPGRRRSHGGDLRGGEPGELADRPGARGAEPHRRGAREHDAAVGRRVRERPVERSPVGGRRDGDRGVGEGHRRRRRAARSRSESACSRGRVTSTRQPASGWG